MKKKTIALVLCLLMVLSLAGCGSQKDVVEEAGQSAQQDTTAETTAAQTEAPTQPPETEPIETEPVSQVGDTILFGTYEQDNDLENGPEPIEWTILDEDETGYLLISTYVLDYAYYHSSGDVTLWPDSDIRAWLNGDFYNDNFTDAERAQIRLTVNTETTEVSRGQHYFQCDPTEDYFFLLSVAEVYQYYPDMNEISSQNGNRSTGATSYAYDRIVNRMGVDNVDACVNVSAEALGVGAATWLLRSVIEPNAEYFSTKCWPSVVHINTEVGGAKHALTVLPYGIRPVLWISR